MTLTLDFFESKLGKPLYPIDAANYSTWVWSHTPFSKWNFRHHEVSEKLESIDILGDYWIVAWMELSPGTSSIYQGDELIPLSGSFLMVHPPFSVVKFVSNPGIVNWFYLLIRAPYPSALPHQATVYPIENARESVLSFLGQDLSKIREKLLEMKEGFSISYLNSDHVLALKLKKEIDRCFRTHFDIQMIAEQWRVSSASLSRLFKKAFGLSPVKYRNQMRMMQASIDLLFEQMTVEETYLGVGLEDSRHFHQKFKDQLLTTPSVFSGPKK